MTASTTAIMPMVWYCRFRNASAPSRMAFEITCISAVPESDAMTARAMINATAKASSATPIAIHR